MQPQPDLSSLQAFLDASMSSDPLVVQPDDADTQGMSFADLFSHYLAPEVAKLPPSSSSSSTATAAAELPSFDPSTFMPSTMPGSPFSPESDDQRSSTSSSGLNGGLHDRSPVSLADLDFSTAPVLSGSSEGFAIDPSVFEAPTFAFDADAILALPDLSSSSSVSASNASTSTAAAAAAAPDLSQMTPAVLPPLPSLPVAPPAPVTASGRPKRGVVHSVIREHPEEEEEVADVARGGDDDDDENMYSSDASSSVADRRNQPAARTSRTRRPTKKARSASPSVSVSGTVTGDEDHPSARKLARTSVVPLASATLHKTAANSHLPPVPMWADKPDPKEYAKLSSKEKRQLRNKISARNFRHRRKEYLTTLEDEISTRDTIISELQDEVGVIRAENTGLRTEVATLREQWQNLLDKLSSMTTPPAATTSAAAATGLGTNPPRVIAASSSSTTSAVKQEESAEMVIMPETTSSTTSTRRVGTRSTSGIQVPNLSKDVAPLSRRSNSSNSKNNWGAAAGTFMSVHTTLVPDVPHFTNLADGLHGKPSLAATAASSPFSNQSFNPAMNALTPSQLASLPAMTAHTRSGPAAATASNDASSRTPQQPQPSGTFQDLFASNPFYLRPDALDQSRAALYGKLANNAAGLLAAQKQAGEQPAHQTDQQQQQQQQSARDERAYLPIPNGFRPAFFTSPKASSSTASELLAFQSPSAAAAAAAAAASSSIPSAPTLSHQEAVELRQQATMAQVAHLANQTLVQRLASSFWDAFVGPSPVAAAGGGNRTLDTDKVKAVLLGQARVQVVPNSTNSTSPALTPSSLAEPSGIDALERQMGALEVGGAGSGGSSRSDSPERCSFAQVGRRWLTGEKRV